LGMLVVSLKAVNHGFWFHLSLVFTSSTSTKASNRDDPSESEIQCKHKHKQNHPNLTPFWKTVWA